MTKGLIKYIVAINAVALIGLVMLQIFWLRQDADLKEQQFDINVNAALKEIVRKVETREALSVMLPKIERIDKDKITIVTNEDGGGLRKLRQDRRVSLENQDDRINITDESQIQIEIQHEDGPPTSTTRHFTRQLQFSDSLTSENKITLSLDTSRQNEDMVYISREKGKIEEELAKYSQMFTQLAMDMVFLDRPLEERVDTQQLEQIISEEMKSHGIKNPYNYKLVSNPVEQPVTFNPDGTVMYGEMNFVYHARLFPNNLLADQGLLLLHFPNKEKYILSSMWLMVGSSLLFILVIILSFTATILTIIRQKKLSDMKTDFINNMTHELKTPVSTISLASEMLQVPSIASNGDSIRRYARIIFEENKRLGNQVEKVLQIAQLEKEDFQIKISPVNLHNLIVKAVEKAGIQIENRKGKVTLDLRAANCIIQGDEHHLTNVVFNLLDNANKYSPEKPEIVVATSNIPNGVLLAVTDKGIGITKDEQKRIFEKFYRVSTGNVHDVQGFGLGLAYVKRITDMHGGTVKVHSEIKKGSSFELFLPFKQ